MYLVISSTTFLFCVGVGLAYPHSNPWNPFQTDFDHEQQYQQEQESEYVGPAYFGEMHNPAMTRLTRNPQPDPTFRFFGNGIMSGINFFDNVVPRVDLQTAVNPIQPYADAKNFTRPRRHETNATNAQVVSTEATLMNQNENSTLTTPDTFYTIVTPMTPMMEDKMDTPNSAKPKTAELEAMISQLNKALEYIQTHGNEKVNEEISEKTSTEKLVQYISSNVEQITKNKNPETRNVKVKQVSKALDILLNRIAKSAKDLIPRKTDSATVNDEPKAATNPLLMARIVQHVNDMKTHIVSDKINNGYELSSAELDGGLTAQFRPVRQDENTNSIDDDADDDDDDDVSKDVEQIATTTTTTSKPLEVTARQEESSEQQSSSQEGGGNLVANLLSSFLGSLSKPNGAVDVDAIVGLVSGLSVQKDDGSFDFGGVTDLLQSFLGGDSDDGGGSDVGAFLGGLLGAVIQGSANPPGPKGTGRLTGNLVANILPGLSGPAPPSSSEENGNGMQQPQKPIDSGSFLAGLLTSMLGSSSGTSSGGGAPMNGADNNKMGSAGFFMKLKNELFKTIFSLITSILGASSGGISQASGASSGASSSKFGGKH